MGNPGPVGSRAGDLRLGGRSHQLRQRARLRTRRGGPATPPLAARTPFARKDILKFHCVIWPALLIAAGYQVPRQLFVHGYLLIDDRKISKSLGNVIDPLDLVSVYGIDPVRFFLLRVTPFGQDGSASIEGLHERYERELANELGNLLSRTTAMIARYREGRLPGLQAALVDSPFRQTLDELGTEVASRLDRFDLSGALDDIWAVVRNLNRYVEERAPWKLAKDATKAAELDGTLYDLADGLRAVAVALAAYLPETAPRILAALGQPPDLGWRQVGYGLTEPVGGIEPARAALPPGRVAYRKPSDRHPRASRCVLCPRPAI